MFRSYRLKKIGRNPRRASYATDCTNTSAPGYQSSLDPETEPLFYTMHLGAPTEGARKSMLFVQAKEIINLYFLGLFVPSLPLNADCTIISRIQAKVLSRSASLGF